MKAQTAKRLHCIWVTFWVLVALILCIYAFTRCTKVDTTIDNGTLVDIDGNLYHTAVYGSQTWMLEDLIVNHYNNGDCITKHPDGYYTFYMVETNKLCPINWHVPASWEFEVLNEYFDNNDVNAQIGNLGYWWSSSNIVEGYESPQARAWYQNMPGTSITEFIALKEQYLGIRCIKDY